MNDNLATASLVNPASTPTAVGARRVWIAIGRRGAWAEASITDDGPAEPRPAVVGAGSGSGLIGLSERVSALGGRFPGRPHRRRWLPD